MKPRLFVASSTESIDIAYAVQENLDREMEVTVWTQGIFELSQTALASLYGLTGRVDAAAFVFSPNDEAFVRGKLQPAVRDNVVFELGLFVGALGPDKCFVLKPRSFTALNFPSHQMGITPADDEDDRQDGNSIAALGVACNRIRRSLHIDKLHPPVPHGRVEAASSIIQRTLHQIITGNLFRLLQSSALQTHLLRTWRCD